MNTMEANSLVRGMVFVVQKARSNITESIGPGETAQELLAEINPLLFGERSVLPRLIKWQAQCRESGVIKGSDLFNLFKFIDMSTDRACLGLLAVYGYTAPEEADLAWFTQTWQYLDV